MYNHQCANYVCPLCQIAKGEMTEKGSNEEFVIFRNDLVTVFIAGKWWRTNPGHVIIVPNTHVENIYDLPEKIGHAVFDLSKKVAIALKETYMCDGVSTKQHNEPAGNQEVWHYHFHVIPRYTGDDHYLKGGDMYWPNMEEKRPYADKLKAFLQDSFNQSESVRGPRIKHDEVEDRLTALWVKSIDRYLESNPIQRQHGDQKYVFYLTAVRKQSTDKLPHTNSTMRTKLENAYCAKGWADAKFHSGGKVVLIKEGMV